MSEATHLLLCGAAGFTNRGDDAILWGMLSQLRRRLGPRAVKVAGGPELGPLLAPFGGTALTYDDRAELARAIEDADLVILGGGGMLYDIEYQADLARLLGDPPDRQWLYELVKLASAARAVGRPVMGYSLGIGPLVSTAARQMARFLGDTVQALTVRDQASADLLVECGLSPARVQVAADPAVLVEPGAGNAVEEWLRAHDLADLPRPWIGLNLRPWFRFLGSDQGREEKMAELTRAMAEVVKGLRSRLGATVIMLPFQHLNDDDGPVLEQVQAALAADPQVVLVEPPPLPPDLVGVLGRLDLFVGMRMHSLLLAAAAGTPFVALPYSPKVTATAEALDMAAFMHPVEDLDPAAVVASCETVLRAREAVQSRLLAARQRLRASADLSLDLACWLLEGGARRPRPVPAAVTRPEVKGLRVLMQIRPDFREKPGGDVVQLEELLPFLREAGVTVELTGETKPDLSQWDVVHTINLDRPEEPYAHCLNALEQGRPVALSTVHTDLSEFLTWGDTDYWRLPPPEEGLPEPQPAPSSTPVEVRLRALTHLQRQAIVDWATGYLPNSQGNLKYLQQAFGLEAERAVVVPNGVREAFFAATPDLFVDRYGLRDFVLCVGRIEKKKNQLSLIAALRGLGLPLVIVGRANPPEYAELCRRYADESVRFIEHLSEEELVSACAAAKVHALASWVELPGLTTLEAGAAGCNVVSTNRGSPPEYLRDMAWYCDPRDPASIREAVLAAYHAPRTDRLREHLRANYTWRHAAEKTLEGYRLAMGLHARRSEADRRAAEVGALRRHAEWLERLAADRCYELRYAQETLQQAQQYVAQLETWGHNLQVQEDSLKAHSEQLGRDLVQCREEFERVTSRRAYRWADSLSRLGANLLRILRVKR